MATTKPASEYKIRPVSRFVVTEYREFPNGKGTVVAEVDTRVQATKIVEAFTGESNHSAWNILPEHDVPSMLRNIAEDAAQWTKRGIVVLMQENDTTLVFGLGAKVGDPDEILAAGHSQLKELYPIRTLADTRDRRAA